MGPTPSAGPRNGRPHCWTAQVPLNVHGLCRRPAHVQRHRSPPLSSPPAFSRQASSSIPTRPAPDRPTSGHLLLGRYGQRDAQGLGGAGVAAQDLAGAQVDGVGAPGQPDRVGAVSFACQCLGPGVEVEGQQPLGDLPGGVLGGQWHDLERRARSIHWHADVRARGQRPWRTCRRIRTMAHVHGDAMTLAWFQPGKEGALHGWTVLLGCEAV